MQHCSNYLRTIIQNHSPPAYKSQWGPLVGRKRRTIPRKSIKKVFCFELLSSTDFMLVISSLLLPWLPQVTFGWRKTNREGASLNTFNSSTQPTKQETLVWWNELLTGRQAFQRVRGLVAVSPRAIDQVTWTISPNVQLHVLLIHWEINGLATSAISKSQPYNIPREAFQRDRWLLLKRERKLFSHLQSLKVQRMTPVHH